MQHKTIKIAELLKDNLIFLELKNIDININKLFTEEILNIYFEETITPDNYVFFVEDDIKKAKEASINLIIEEIEKNKKNLLNDIAQIIHNKYLSLFLTHKQRKQIKNIKLEINLLDEQLNNIEHISKKVSTKIIPINPDKNVNVPKYQLEPEETIYVVLQDFENYLKIKKMKVKNKKIEAVKNFINYETDYEFNYLIESEDLTFEIKHYNFRKFDGFKCKVNDYVIFKNINEAKKHCHQVLEGINKKILNIMEQIDDF